MLYTTFVLYQNNKNHQLKAFELHLNNFFTEHASYTFFLESTSLKKTNETRTIFF
jgi:hypothetical protein